MAALQNPVLKSYFLRPPPEGGLDLVANRQGAILFFLGFPIPIETRKANFAFKIKARWITGLLQ